MIRHIVLTRFRPDISEGKITEIYMKLARLTEQLHGARNFTGGRSISPEHMERGYHHAFVIDFDSWENLKRYADHADHKAISLELIENATDQHEGIIVLDLEIADTA